MYVCMYVTIVSNMYEYTHVMYESTHVYIMYTWQQVCIIWIYIYIYTFEKDRTRDRSHECPLQVHNVPWSCLNVYVCDVCLDVYVCVEYKCMSVCMTTRMYDVYIWRYVWRVCTTRMYDVYVWICERETLANKCFAANLFAVGNLLHNFFI